jgi:hypothetical protein
MDIADAATAAINVLFNQLRLIVVLTMPFQSFIRNIQQRAYKETVNILQPRNKFGLFVCL